MDITIKFQLDCTSRLESVVTALLSGIAPKTYVAKTDEAETTVVNKSPEGKPKETPAPPEKILFKIDPPKPTDESKDEDDSGVEGNPGEYPSEQVKEPVDEREEKNDEAHTVSAVDMRRAVDACMKRLGGDKDAIIKQSIRQLLKVKLEEYGVQTAPKIPTNDQRAEFVNYCQNVQLNGDAPF